MRLPDSYQLNDDRQEIAPAAPSRADCGLPADAFVFACFNATYKIDPRVFDAWMRILGRVPGSVLWLMETAPASVGHLRARGGRPRRSIPRGFVFARLVDKALHLARHRLAGLFLDTPMCNAHTTASDALWAGLPVLTTPGATFASRVAASLLAAAAPAGAGRAATSTAYVETAVRLASDRPRWRALTARLRADPARLPLFDTARTVRALESAYLRMWERRLRGDPPACFDVSGRRLARILRGVEFDLSAGRIWRRLTRDERLAAARHFWSEPASEAVGLADGAVVKILHVRPQAVRTLSAERKASALASVAEPSELLAASLLVALHLGERRALLAAFLDATGLPHDNGLLAEDASARAGSRGDGASRRARRSLAAFPRGPGPDLPEHALAAGPRSLGIARTRRRPGIDSAGDAF